MNVLYVADIRLVPILIGMLNIGVVAAIAFIVYNKFLKKRK